LGQGEKLGKKKSAGRLNLEKYYQHTRDVELLQGKNAKKVKTSKNRMKEQLPGEGGREFKPRG